MSKILRLLNISENTSLNNRLPLVAGMMDNSHTTKYTAVKPSRNLLAIFVPKIHRATNFMIATGAKARHILNISKNRYILACGGLKDLIQDRYGNKSCHLCMVVNTRLTPFEVKQLLTKNTGGHNRA